MPNILFICTANQIRSVLAEMAFRKELQKRGIASKWKVGSAGTFASDGIRAYPGVRECAIELGLPSVDAHRSRRLTAELVEAADAIIVMTRRHREDILRRYPGDGEKIHLLSECVDGPGEDIPDPGMGEAALEDVAREIATLVEAGFEKICALAGEAPG